MFGQTNTANQMYGNNNNNAQLYNGSQRVQYPLDWYRKKWLYFDISNGPMETHFNVAILLLLCQVGSARLGFTPIITKNGQANPSTIMAAQ